nr:HAD-IA family hydrolase [Anaerolineae bacterium]
RELEVAPEQSLVIEDSPSGVKAAQKAGMKVVAVSTPFTQGQLHKSGLIPESHIVDDPAELLRVVDHVSKHARQEFSD